MVGSLRLAFLKNCGEERQSELDTATWQTMAPLYNAPATMDKPGETRVRDAAARKEPLIVGGYCTTDEHLGYLTKDDTIDKNKQSG